MTEETASLQAPQDAIEPSFTRYILGVLLLVAAFYVSPYVLLRLPRTGTTFHHELDYAWDLKGTDADIVILGESSALHGEDPIQIASTLHLKTVNLSNTLGSLILGGDIELQHYLKANRRPKLIVFYLSLWNLDYRNKPKFTKFYEGEYMLMKHGTPNDIFNFAKSRTSMFLQFPFSFYAVFATPGSLSHLFHPTLPPATEAHMGFYPDTNMPLLGNSCLLSEDYANPSMSIETAKNLLNSYKGAADKVMVYVAPVPACSNTQAVLTLPYEALHASAPKMLAPANFIDDDAFIHVTPPSVPESTGVFIEAIQRSLTTDPSPVAPEKVR